MKKLEVYNIKSKKDWKLWLLKNHTDRGGDLNIVQLVNGYASMLCWCK